MRVRAISKGRTLGPVYYLYLAFMAVLLALALRSAVRLRRNMKSRGKAAF